MKKALLLFSVIIFAVLSGCSKKNADKTDVECIIQIGEKLPNPLVSLSETIFSNKMFVYVDGLGSWADEDTGRWHGHGARVAFAFPRTTETELKEGTYSVETNMIEASYSEDFNNEGPNYLPVFSIVEGILKVSKKGNNKFILEFTGVDENGLSVNMGYEGFVLYKFMRTDQLAKTLL